MRGVALGIFLAIVISCGGAQIDRPPIDPRDNEITALWTQIRDWRREAHMSLDPTKQDEMMFGPKSFGEVKHVCPENHHVPKTCDDVCNLKDDICDNAERICNLADELGKGDDYAQEKCRNAKASCREATQRCCDCSASADASGGGL